MEEGTFVTGVELLNTPTVLSQPSANKPKLDEKTVMPSLVKTSSSNKANRTLTALSKVASPNKSDTIPPITREVATTKSAGLRTTMAEQAMKKPLFQKLAGVKEFFDKTKSPTEVEKIKSASALKSPVSWKSRKEEQDEKKYTHADAFDVKIVQKFDDLYKGKTKSGAFATNGFENLAKKKHFFDEVEKQETRVQEEQKKFNDIAYEIAKKQKLLEKLLTQSADFDKRLSSTANLEQECLDKEDRTQEWLAKIELEEHNNKCLQHMKQLKKELLLSIKKRYLQHQDDFKLCIDGEVYYKKVEEETKLLNRKMEELSNKIKSKGGKENLIDVEFEDLLANEVSEFEERRNLREILKHEKEIEEELQLEMEAKERQAILDRENKLREEENRRLQKDAEHQKELTKIKKQYLEFQKVTNVSRKEQLLEYLESLEEKTATLEKEIGDVQENIKGKKEHLIELRKDLKYKKFEEVKPSKDNFRQDIRIDDLDIMLRDKHNDIVERENNVKRLEKVSYEVCTVISRILKQLQKSNTPNPVDQSNVINLLSICGLKLERMLTVVIKKRKTFFIESINTDGTIKEGPPTYMNLVSDDVYNKSKKRYEKESLNNIDEEYQDAELSGLRGEIRYKDKRELMA